MGAQRDGILRIHHCLGCGYNLRGLPDGHACPECGKMPQSTYAWGIPAYRSTAARFKSRQAGVTIIVVYFSCLVLAVVLPYGGGVILPGVIVGAIVLAAVGRLILQREEHELTLIVDSDSIGVLIRAGKPPRRHLLQMLDRVLVRRAGPGCWRLRIPYAPTHRMTGSPIDVLVKASRREIAVYRNELRRRIAAARRD